MFRRSHLCIVAVDFLHQEPARTVADPITAHRPGEVTQVSRMTNVHPKFLETSHGSVEIDFLNQEPDRTVRDPFTAYVSREVTQVSRMSGKHPKFLEKSHR